MMELRDRVRRRFRTQERFAVATNIREEVISKILRGVRRPTKDQVRVMAGALGISQKEFVSAWEEAHGTTTQRRI